MAGQLHMRRNCAPELGLVTEKETSDKFAEYAQSFCNQSSSQALEIREVIGFIAPWHKYGYRAAKYLHHKMSSIAPLWLRVLPRKEGASDGKNESFEIAGLDFVKEQEVWSERISNKGCQVLQHVSLEGWANLKALKALMQKPEPLAEQVAEICHKYSNAGIVLDVRLALFSSVKPLLAPMLAAFSKRLRAAGRRLLISVPAEPQNQQWHAPEFDAGDAAAIAPLVDAVIVGTRDYSRKERGPSAPLPWVKSSIKRLLTTESGGNDGFRPDQLLMEIPLYGRAFKDTEEDGQLILTPQLVKAMKQHRPQLLWDSEAAEHSMTMTDGKAYMSVPTLAFVRDRLRLAHSLGVGVAFRELGAGLDYAFDLLTVRSGRAPPAQKSQAEALPERPASSESQAKAKPTRTEL